MTHVRRIAVLAVATVLATTGCQAFESSPGSSVVSSSPGSSTTRAAEAVTVTIADFDRSADGSIVRVVGLVRVPSSVRIVEGHCPVMIEDRGHPGDKITAWIRVSDANPPASNTMAELPSNYVSNDLLLITENGSAIRDGDSVALTGIVKKSDGGRAYLDYVTRIEVAEVPAAPAPETVTIADLGGAADETVVRVVGLIQVPESTSTVDGHGSLRLQDATNPKREITVWVRVGSGTPPPPNTMEDLPSGYRASDLVLAAEDGTLLHHGDAVALTGTVRKRTSGSAYLDYVTRIEVAKAPLPKPVAVNFKTINKQKEGTLVRLTGRLDVGFHTSCYATCGIYLEDPTTGAIVPIEVTLGVQDERTPNTMWPLPVSYERSDLRVIGNDKRVIRGGARVRVTGWWDSSTIDPVVRIDYAP